LWLTTRREAASESRGRREEEEGEEEEERGRNMEERMGEGEGRGETRASRQNSQQQILSPPRTFFAARDFCQNISGFFSGIKSDENTIIRAQMHLSVVSKGERGRI
jgi:hypothetical protein